MLALLSRMVTFSNNVEPANGFLVRYLHRKLMETESDCSANDEDLLRVLDWVPKLWYHLHTFLEKHSTSDFLIGKGALRASDGSRSPGLNILLDSDILWPVCSNIWIDLFIELS